MDRQNTELLTPEAKTVLHCAEGYVTIVTSADPCLEGTREVSESTRISGDGQYNLPKVSRDGHNITDAQKPLHLPTQKMLLLRSSLNY